MSNIFDFPPDRRDRATPGFLNDSVDLVRFDDLGRNTLLDDETDCVTCHDWTNQELASIYRVRSLLEAAGVSTAVERGLSDEGEPWCVFCRPDGEVFIHLCRIDGRYLLDSPNLRRPLAGDTFAELVDSFSDAALMPADVPDTRRGRVVRLDRDGNVFLHPVTMLAALVWTILLRSEDLVLVEVDPEEGRAGAEWLAALGEPALDDEAALGLPAAEAGTAQQQTGRFGDDARPVNAEAGGGPREALTKLLMHAPLGSVAAGLSTIAIACGFMSESLPHRDGGTGLTLLDEGGAAQPDEGHDGAEAAVDAGTDDTGLAALIQSIMRLSETAELDAAIQAEATAAPGDGPMTDNLAGEGAGDPAGTMPPEIGGIAASSARAVEDGALPVTGEAGQAAHMASRPPQTGTAEPDGTAGALAAIAQMLSIDDIKRFIHDELRSIQIGNITLQATFDLASVDVDETAVLDAALAAVHAKDDFGNVEVAYFSPLSSVELSPSGAGVDASDRYDISVVSMSGSRAGGSAAPYGQRKKPAEADPGDEVTEVAEYAPFDDHPKLFDSNVQEFFYYLRGKSNTELLFFEDEVVLIDFSVPRGQPPLLEEWQLSHGGTVITVGARADYEAFDLIA